MYQGKGSTFWGANNVHSALEMYLVLSPSHVTHGKLGPTVLVIFFPFFTIFRLLKTLTFFLHSVIARNLGLS